MPIAIFLWCVGWSLYWIGGKKETAKPKMITQANALTFTVILQEQKIEA